jgi:hypothetical protein
MKFIIPFLLFTLITITITAQNLSYSSGTTEVEGEIVKTINVKLDPKPETVKGSFENWMEDNYDVDLDGKRLLFFDKKVMSAKGVVIPAISSRRIDLNVRVDESNEDFTTLQVYASFGYNNWITPMDYPYEYAALEGIVYEYISDYLPEYYLNRIEDTKEQLADLKEDKEELNEDEDLRIGVPDVTIKYKRSNRRTMTLKNPEIEQEENPPKSKSKKNKLPSMPEKYVLKPSIDQFEDIEDPQDDNEEDLWGDLKAKNTEEYRPKLKSLDDLKANKLDMLESEEGSELGIGSRQKLFHKNIKKFNQKMQKNREVMKRKKKKKRKHYEGIMAEKKKKKGRK